MSIFLTLLLSIQTLQIGKLPFLPRAFAPGAGTVYYIGETNTEIMALRGDSSFVLYSQDIPIRAIERDPLFLYLLDREGLKCLTLRGEMVGILKSGRFRDLAVAEQGLIFLLSSEGNKIYIMSLSEEEYPLNPPALRIKCSREGYIALKREKKITITDTRGTPIRDIKGDYKDFAFVSENLYVASDSGIMLFPLDDEKAPQYILKDSTIQFLEAAGDSLFVITKKGEFYIIVPTS